MNGSSKIYTRTGRIKRCMDYAFDSMDNTKKGKDIARDNLGYAADCTNNVMDCMDMPRTARISRTVWIIPRI
jgi:hypothetical protein